MLDGKRVAPTWSTFAPTWREPCDVCHNVDLYPKGPLDNQLHSGVDTKPFRLVGARQPGFGLILRHSRWFAVKVERSWPPAVGALVGLVVVAAESFHPPVRAGRSRVELYGLARNCLGRHEFVWGTREKVWVDLKLRVV